MAEPHPSLGNDWISTTHEHIKSLHLYLIHNRFLLGLSDNSSVSLLGNLSSLSN